MSQGRAGVRICVLGLALVLVAACGATPIPATSATPSSPISTMSASIPPGPTASAAATPTAAGTGTPSATTSVAPSPSPSAPATAQVGLAWERVTDPDLVGVNGRLRGVIAGGPGAIAWGRVEGIGPRIWTSPNGRDWMAAALEVPNDPDYTTDNNGGVFDVTAGGPGYVAVGWYMRGPEAANLVVPLVWTSTDGRTWRRVPTGRAFADSMVSRAIGWKGELLAFGSGPWAGVQSAPPIVWTSKDGVSWTRSTPRLPASVGEPQFAEEMTASADALWSSGWVGVTTIDDPHLGQPPRLTSRDGRTWTISPLPSIGGNEQLHPLHDGLYLTITLAGTTTSPAWMTRSPGVYRSRDLKTWTALAVGRPLGAEIIAVGDTLVMVGTGAWRSTDGGRTWQSVPVTGRGPSDATMTAAAALPDGTLVAVDTYHWGSRPAAWVSPPQSKTTAVHFTTNASRQPP